jgi:hypothetical protein
MESDTEIPVELPVVEPTEHQLRKALRLALLQRAQNALDWNEPDEACQLLGAYQSLLVNP